MTEIANWNDHEGLWEGAVGAVDRMPQQLKFEFVEFIEQRVKDEPEKDSLAKEITKILTGIKEDWTKFKPDDWNAKSLDWLGRNMRCAWELIQRLDEIKKDEHEEAAMKKALVVFDGGCEFSQIEIDGVKIAMDNGVPTLAIPIPDDNIPF